MSDVPCLLISKHWNRTCNLDTGSWRLVDPDHLRHNCHLPAASQLMYGSIPLICDSQKGDIWTIHIHTACQKGGIWTIHTHSAYQKWGIWATGPYTPTGTVRRGVYGLLDHTNKHNLSEGGIWDVAPYTPNGTVRRGENGQLDHTHPLGLSEWGYMGWDYNQPLGLLLWGGYLNIPNLCQKECSQDDNSTILV